MPKKDPFNPLYCIRCKKEWYGEEAVCESCKEEIKQKAQDKIRQEETRRHEELKRQALWQAQCENYAQGFSLRRVIGAITLIFGVGVLFMALNMDTTVQSDGLGRVHNIGLLNDRLVAVMVGGFVSLGGLMMSLWPTQDSPLKSEKDKGIKGERRE